MLRTVSIKIEAPPGFEEYLATCAEIYNKYVDWSFANNSYSKTKAHKELYEKLKLEYPGIPTGILQCIRDTALEAVKAVKFKFRPNKRPTSSVRYDKRTIAFRKGTLHVSWSGERIKRPIKIPEFFKRRYSDWKFQSATIGWDKRNKCIKANLNFTCDAPPKVNGVGEDKVVGIDRGIYNIVYLSNGFKHSSSKLRAIKRKNLFVKRGLQAKGTKSAMRRLKSLNGRERRFSTNENHIITNLLVKMPFDTFVLEDLSGIRERKPRGKVINKCMSDWSFWQMERFLAYKAESLGKTVVTVDPRYTSQRCYNCKKICKSNRKGSSYHCSDCGYKLHADLNAALNIRDSYLISAAEKQKAGQATSQLAECIGSKEPSASCFTENAAIDKTSDLLITF